jgi:hypothetical protein
MASSTRRESCGGASVGRGPARAPFPLLVHLIVVLAMTHAVVSATNERVRVTAPGPASVDTTPITFTTTTTAYAGCGGMERCIANTHCAGCIEAINATAGFPHSIPVVYKYGHDALRMYVLHPDHHCTAVFKQCRTGGGCANIASSQAISDSAATARCSGANETLTVQVCC